MWYLSGPWLQEMLKMMNSHKQTEELHRRARYAQSTLESVLQDSRLTAESFLDISVELQTAWKDTEHQDLDEINEMKLLEGLMDQDTSTECFQTVITQVKMPPYAHRCHVEHTLCTEGR